MFTKSQVGFEHPARGADHCSDCKHYRAASERCEIVSGVIMPEDWCRKYMPATSVAQRKAMAIAEYNPGELYSRNKGLLKLSHSQLHDFAATKQKGLPQYVSKKQRRFKI